MTRATLANGRSAWQLNFSPVWTRERKDCALVRYEMPVDMDLIVPPMSSARA